ncbi:MAG: hypothetical protein ABIT20_17760 [Gemmatimonadaceae bacterium]
MYSVFLFLAIVGGTIGVLQALGALVGAVGHDAPVGAEHDVGGHSADPIDAFHFRSVRAIAAGVGFAGLGGLLALRQFSAPVALLLAVSLGLIIYLFVAFVMRGFTRLESDGSLRALQAVGSTATVTLPVGGAFGVGKVALIVGGRHVEWPAVLAEGAPPGSTLSAGTRVQVVDAADDTTLSVVPLP